MTNKPKAIIYCRVSTKEQADEGNSLGTQQKLCREYCRTKGYEVAEVYIEAGESAKTANRPELQDLLGRVSKKKHNIAVVVVYKSDRLARNIMDHYSIKALLNKHDVQLESVTENFTDDPVGRLTENMVASFNQFDNEVRAQRCKGGMIDACEKGRYVVSAPVGYINGRVDGKPNLVKSNQADLVAEMFELYATGGYTMDELRAEMTDRGLISRLGKPYQKSYFPKILSTRTYTGKFEMFDRIFQGSYEPIISEVLFEKVQKVITNKGNKVAVYKKDCKEFPLRRFVVDSEENKLTGSYSKGRSKAYAYYRFGSGGKNIDPDVLNKKFIKFSDKYSLNQELVQKLKDKVAKEFESRGLSSKVKIKQLNTRLTELETLEVNLTEKFVTAWISESAYNKLAEKTKIEILDVKEKIDSLTKTGPNLLELLDQVESMVIDPGGYWNQASIGTKAKFQWFQFPQGLTYENNKFGTAEISPVFNVNVVNSVLKTANVDPSGFEPLTSCMPYKRSTS